jgi:hypothetical protein
MRLTTRLATRRLLSAAALLLAFQASCAVQESTAAAVGCSEARPEVGGKSTELGAAITAILSRPELRGTHWGISVVNGSAAPATRRSSASTHAPPQPPAQPAHVFQLNADSFFIPASNKKLLATAAALLTHGAGFSFQTPILLDEATATVVLCGAGDPSISQQQLRAAAKSALAGRVASLLQQRDVAVLGVEPDGALLSQTATRGTSVGLLAVAACWPRVTEVSDHFNLQATTRTPTQVAAASTRGNSATWQRGTVPSLPAWSSMCCCLRMRPRWASACRTRCC